MAFAIRTLSGKRCHLEASQDIPREDVDDHGRMIEATFLVPTSREILV